MSDPSKYFPHAGSLLVELQADAVVVLVIGGRMGSGAAPALALDRANTPEAVRRNTLIVRGLVASLQAIAERLEQDVAKSGVQLEPRS